MSKHTPGPWKVDKRERETLITAAAMPYVAAVSSSLHGQPGTGEANARLIAAAPDLLDALQCYVMLYASLDTEGKQKLRDRAEAAITKAEGCDE